MNNNGTLKKLRYFKGQVLTERDFNDQQSYHVRKLEEFVKRFPTGVISGLYVKFNEAETAFEIKEGVAVDDLGRIILVPEEGLLVPVSTFRPEETGNFLSIYYDEAKTCAEKSICEPESKFNRIEERAGFAWDKIPNDTNNHRITLAYITGENPPFTIIPTEDEPGINVDPELQRPVRIDALVFDERKITFRDFDGHTHTGGGKGTQIPEEGLADGAVTTNKIADGAVTQKKVAEPFKADPKGPAGGDLMGNYPNPTIAEGVVTQLKLAPEVTTPPSGPAGGDLTGTYPGPIIANDKITSPKIDDADNTNVDDTTIGSGIKTPHIHTGAITSAKIRKIDGSFDSTTDYGIKTDHIQNRVVTEAKIELFDPANPNPTGIQTSNIADEAVTWEKIEHTNDTDKIQTDNIADGAVKITKVDLIEGASLPGTVPAASPPPGIATVQVTFSGVDFDKPRIAQVIPTSPSQPITPPNPQGLGLGLSWNLRVVLTGAQEMTYFIDVLNHSPDNIEFEARILRLG